MERISIEQAHPQQLQRRSLNSTQPVFLFIVMAVLTLALLLQFLFDRTNNTFSRFSVPMAVVGLAIGGGIFLYGLRRKNFNLLEIIYPLTALYMLTYPLRGLFILAFPQSTNYIFGFPVTQKHFLAFGLLFFNIGFLSFSMGYFWRIGKTLALHLPRITWANNTRNLLWKGLLIYGIGFASFVVLFLGGNALRFQWNEESRLSAVYNLAIFLSGFRYLGVYLIWTADLTRRRTYRLLPWVIAGLEIFIGVVIGSKQAIFQLILAILFAYYYTNRRITRKALLYGGLFIVVFFPLVQTYRNVYKNTFGFNPDPNINEVVALTGEVSTSFQREASINNAFEQVMNRANQLDYLTMILYRVPFYINYTSTLWPNIVAAFVPRLLWPDKPVLVLGRYMVNVILGSPSSSNAPITNIGEFYLNFGTFWVPIGMLILGVFFRLIYEYLRVATPSRILQGALYLAVFPAMLFLSTGIASFPASITRTFLTMCVIFAIFFRGRH